MVKYELVANGGTYTNKSGEEKKRWVKMGIVVETQKGLSIKVESIPVGWDGWAILSEPREKPTHGGDSLDQDVPF